MCQGLKTGTWFISAPGYALLVYSFNYMFIYFSKLLTVEANSSYYMSIMKNKT